MNTSKDLEKTYEIINKIKTKKIEFFVEGVKEFKFLGKPSNLFYLNSEEELNSLLSYLEIHFDYEAKFSGPDWYFFWYCVEPDWSGEYSDEKIWTESLTSFKERISDFLLILNEKGIK